MNQELHSETLKYIKETKLNHRNKLGQYFTPRTLREILFSKLPKIKKPKILDPASGTGEFLITTKEHFKDAQIFGWEIDQSLVRISRKVVPHAKIERVDSLRKSDDEKFDFIVGNPPYFEFKPDDYIREKYGEIINGRANIYSIFVYKSINLLKEGGYIAFVVPPSMNNGAYFSKLRNFIVNNCNIEYLSIQKDVDLFNDAQQSVMLLILKKGLNKGDYIFKKNGILIFSENKRELEKTFKESTTLIDLGYEVQTGKLVWNQNKHLLTNKAEGNIPLIWSKNITRKGLILNNTDKPQYAKISFYDEGPAIVTNRIIGQPGKGTLRAAIIPKGMKFIAENHVNVIYPKKQNNLLPVKVGKVSQWKLLDQLNSPENTKILQNITGNTQISKNELEKLFPIRFIAKRLNQRYLSRVS